MRARLLRSRDLREVTRFAREGERRRAGEGDRAGSQVNLQGEAGDAEPTSAPPQSGSVGERAAANVGESTAGGGGMPAHFAVATVRAISSVRTTRRDQWQCASAGCGRSRTGTLSSSSLVEQTRTTGSPRGSSGTLARRDCLSGSTKAASSPCPSCGGPPAGGGGSGPRAGGGGRGEPKMPIGSGMPCGKVAGAIGPAVATTRLTSQRYRRYSSFSWCCMSKGQ